MKRNDPCWCGSGVKYKNCHLAFDQKIDSMKFDFFKGQVRPPKKIICNERDIECIRKSGVINDGALDIAEKMVKPGADTQSINDAVHDYIVQHGGVPADLGYGGFPKSCCISINDVVCHGIPSHKRILKEGDIVNVDITTKLNGYYADASRMYCVGEVSPAAERLVRVAKECMELGIEAIRPWGYIGDIGYACEKHAHANGYSVVTDLGGHGVGKGYHMDPYVPHVGEQGTGMLIVPGMVLTVEPMINEGTYKVRLEKEDGWDIVKTKDGKLSAQWEKTVLVTESGTEVLSS